MNKKTFIETIKVLNGRFCNLDLHIDRLQSTANHFYDRYPEFDWQNINIPDDMCKGLVKCRITYTSQIIAVEFEKYNLRKIASLTLVFDNDIDYEYKSTDRSAFSRLMASKGNCDDILIVKNGLITDTSYSNVVFENKEGLYTPANPLLRGTKRSNLLNKGIIGEREITVQDMSDYSCLYLINAMIDLEDNIRIPLSNIKSIE